MSRISSLAANNQLVRQLLNMQSRMQDLQVQTTSEKVSQDYTGLSRDSERLIGIENTRSLLNRFSQNNGLMDLRLKISDKAMEGMTKTIKDFRNAVLDFDVGSKTDESRVETVQAAAFRALKDLEIHMNTEINGEYLFSGARVTTKPVDFGLSTLASLQTKWDGSAVTYPTYSTNSVHPKLTASTGLPTNSASAAFTNLDFVAGPPGTLTSDIAGAFANIPVGTQITIANATDAGNNTTFTVAANDGTTITLPTGVSFAPQANDTGTANNITITTDISYYSGDEIDQTHRVSKNRSFNLDLNGLDPAFEKAIRAMHIIAQGDFGTAGGLDQNTTRVTDSLYLLNGSVNANPGGTPPYGTESTSNLEQIRTDIGYDRVLMDSVIKTNKSLIGYYEAEIAKTENVDPLTVVTKLLDEQRALETSYQAMARIRSLSLAKYLG